ncbi:MAG TPA: starch-binding protein [Clostridiales bacterium]|nr:starch-binding protein [Clostridiales bacterium]
MYTFKKTAKKLVAFLLCALMVASCGVSALAAEAVGNASPPDYVTNATAKAMWAQCLNTDTTQNIEATQWFEKNGKYYWFLPSSADLTNLVVYHNFTSVTVNGMPIINGNSYSSFENNKEYTVAADGKTFTLVVQKAEGIGSMFITTASGSMDYIHANKDNSETGQMVLVDEKGSVSYDNGLDTIKGRGNTTWANIAKKPYNIKLAKKAALMGMAKSKRWSLLANGQEHSMIRNRFMYDLANDAGLDYSPDSRFVDLYANGEYLGTYQLTQKVELGADNLVDITDLEGNTEDAVKAATGQKDVDLTTYSKYSANKRTAFNIPNNPDDITGGYLMEYVWGVGEPSSFVTKKNQNVDVKSPEACSVSQINYIADFVQDMEDAIYSSTGYNSKGKYYTDYIDTKSAAIMYLLQEFSVNIDGGISSCFFYKDSDITGDGKIHASPCWDFDVALGNLTSTKDGVKMTSYDKWFQKDAYLSNTRGVRTIFGQLCQHSDFNEEVTKLWNESFIPAFNIAFGISEQTDRLKSLKTLENEVQSSSVLNYTRWNLSDNLLVAEAGDTHQQQIAYLQNWIDKRYSFMNTGLADVATAKVTAKAQLDSQYDDYKAKGYSEDILGKMAAAVTEGKNNIDKATTTAGVSTALQNALNKMASYVADTVYFDNSETQWDNVYVFMWGGSTNMSWPGVKIAEAGKDVFAYTVPNGNSNIIFNNGLPDGDGKEQTMNLLIPGNGYIYSIDKSTGVYDGDKKGTVYDGQWKAYSPEPSAVVYGDVDDNMLVNLKDVVILQQYMAKISTLTDNQKIAGDVNGDEIISLKDVVLVQQYVAKMITKFPVEDKVA